MSRAHCLSTGDPLGRVGCEVAEGGGVRTRHLGGAGGGPKTARVFRPAAVVSIEGRARVWRLVGSAAAVVVAGAAIAVVTASAAVGAAAAAGALAAGCGLPCARQYVRCR